MKKYKKYGVIYHFSTSPFPRSMVYESAYAEATTPFKAFIKLLQWYSSRIDACNNPDCQCRYNQMFVSSEMDPDLKASGAYDKITTIK